MDAAIVALRSRFANRAKKINSAGQDAVNYLTVQEPRATEGCLYVVTCGIGKHLAGMNVEDIKNLTSGSFVPIKPDHSWSDEMFQDRVNAINLLKLTVMEGLRKTFEMLQPGGRFPLSHQMVNILSNFSGVHHDNSGSHEFSRHFRVNIQETTLHRYITLMGNFVKMLSLLRSGFIPVNVYRPAWSFDADHSGKWPSHQHLEAAVDRCLADPTNPALTQDLLLQLATDKSQNPFSLFLVSFAALYSVNTESARGTYKSPHNFNSSNSAFLYCIQLIFLWSLYVRVRDPAQISPSHPAVDVLQVLTDICKEFICNTVHTSAGHLLLWRADLKDFSSSTINVNSVIWSNNDSTLTLSGVELHLSSVTVLYLSLVKRLSAVFQDNLLFGRRTLINLMQQSRDWQEFNHKGDRYHFFGRAQEYCQSPQHARLLTAVFDYIIADPGLSTQWFVKAHDMDGHGALTLRPEALASYEAHIDSFLTDLALAIHISAGGPLRGTELLTATWQTPTDGIRSFRIVDGRVIMHTQYHKGMNQTGMMKHNIRYLTEDLGNLYVSFAVLIQGFREALHGELQWANGSTEDFRLPYCLWLIPDGLSYPENHMRNALKTACKRIGITPFNMQQWRQFADAIIKRHFAKDEHHFTHPGESQACSTMESLLHWQLNHTLATANHMYTVNESLGGNQATDSLMRSGWSASSAWQKFHSFAAVIVSPSVARACLLQSHEAVNFVNNPAAADIQLQTMHQDNKMTFKSTEQRLAVQTVCNPSKTEVMINPGTGAGKSMCFMLPASLHWQGVTVVIAPLVALKYDLLLRCQAINLRVTHYDGGNSLPESGLVLVSIELADSSSFLQCLQVLKHRNRLARIVFDEAHMIARDHEFRPSMLNAVKLRLLGVQVVYMSATMPPSVISDLTRSHFLTSTTLIRGNLDWPNLVYSIEQQELLDEAPFIEYATRMVLEWRRRLCIQPTDKCLVFVRSRDECVKVATELRCSYINAGSGTIEERSRTLQDWSNGSEQTLVGTTAIGAGINCASVRLVVHIDLPYSFVDFVQEIGRAGRDGLRSASIILQKAGPVPTNTVKPIDPDLLEYISRKTCLRKVILCNMTGDDNVPTCAVPDYLCMVCRLQQNASAPPTPANVTPAIRKRPEQNDCTGPRVRRKSPEVIVSSSSDEAIPVMSSFEMSSFEATPAARPRLGALESVPLVSVIAPPFHSGPQLFQLSAVHQTARYDSYMAGLAAVNGCCVFCVTKGNMLPIGHSAYRCPGEPEYKSLKTKGMNNATWKIPKYHACFYCGQPQDKVCSRRQSSLSVCAYEDLLLPACVAIYKYHHRDLSQLSETTSPDLATLQTFMHWCFSKTRVFGVQAICGVYVMELWLTRYSSKYQQHGGDRH